MSEKVREALTHLQKILRGPLKPPPDSGAHSERAVTSYWMHVATDYKFAAIHAAKALDALRAESRDGYVLCKAEPVAWMTVDTRYDHIHTFFTKEQAQSVAICCRGTVRPLYAPAEQAGGEDESPTKYYGGPRGGSMSQNAPLAAPTEAEVEACIAHANGKHQYLHDFVLACITQFQALRGGR